MRSRLVQLVLGRRRGGNAALAAALVLVPWLSAGIHSGHRHHGARAARGDRSKSCWGRDAAVPGKPQRHDGASGECASCRYLAGAKGTASPPPPPLGLTPLYTQSVMLPGSAATDQRMPFQSRAPPAA